VGKELLWIFGTTSARRSPVAEKRRGENCEQPSPRTRVLGGTRVKQFEKLREQTYQSFPVITIP
jgi:hypothetical protein